MTDCAPAVATTALLAAVPRPMTAAWLRTPAYDTLMQCHVPPEGAVLGESQAMTRSYVFRHATAASALGVWRWRGLYAHRETLLPLLQGRSVLDFGGAAAPLGLGSLVVDTADSDAYGRPVHVRTLRDCMAAAVFSSHTLEHVPDLGGTLALMRRALVPGGWLVLHVPAWTCERWRAGVHRDTQHGSHVHTFGLELEPPVEGLRGYAPIAAAVSEHLTVTLAVYCGDDSILVLARRDDA